MTVTVNGNSQTVPANATIADLLAQLGMNPKFLAVERNRELVPRKSHNDCRLVDGDVLATANTLIYIGKLRDGDKMSRGLYIAKHRGSACSDEIVRYSIDDAGLKIG